MILLSSSHKTSIHSLNVASYQLLSSPKSKTARSNLEIPSGNNLEFVTEFFDFRFQTFLFVISTTETKDLLFLNCGN